YIFDIHLLGAGDPLQLLAIVFLGVLTSLNVGTVFAAAWVRFGARGPLLIAAGLALALLVAVLVAIPRFAQLAAAFELWWLAAAAGGAIGLSAAGSGSLLRRAIVRRERADSELQDEAPAHSPRFQPAVGLRALIDRQSVRHTQGDDAVLGLLPQGVQCFR